MADLGARVSVRDEHGEWTGTIEKGCCTEHVVVRADPEPGSGPLRTVRVRDITNVPEGQCCWSPTGIVGGPCTSCWRPFALASSRKEQP